MFQNATRCQTRLGWWWALLSQAREQTVEKIGKRFSGIDVQSQVMAMPGEGSVFTEEFQKWGHDPHLGAHCLSKHKIGV